MTHTRYRQPVTTISTERGRCPVCSGTIIGASADEASCLNCGYIDPRNRHGETVLRSYLDMTPDAFERALPTLDRRQRRALHGYLLERSRRLRRQAHEIKDEHDRCQALAKLCRPDERQEPIGTLPDRVRRGS